MKQTRETNIFTKSKLKFCTIFNDFHTNTLCPFPPFHEIMYDSITVLTKVNCESLVLNNTFDNHIFSNLKNFVAYHCNIVSI